jgi:aryl sulfotransferase
MTDTVTWPRKTREVHTRLLDSRVWNDFAFRSDDIIIATYAKSGTTWTQQIVGQLLFKGDPNVYVADESPWMDFRFPPPEMKRQLLEAQSHRRFMKTHLPVDALVFSPKARYIFIGRDARDVVWSFHNHHLNFIPAAYDRFNQTPGGDGPPFDPPTPDIREYWHDWLDRDGFPWWPFWSHLRSWWEIRHLPNVLLLHFASLKRDLPSEIRRIAAFLDIPVDESRWDSIVEHCTFDWMKAHAEQMAPGRGVNWEGGAQAFIHRGTNGRWADVLTPSEVAEYEDRAIHELGPACAHWLATGEGGI